MSFTTHTNWMKDSYESDRLYLLRSAENPEGRLDAHFEGTSIAIGYGYDLIENFDKVQSDLSAIGVILTNTQLKSLSEAITASKDRRSIIASQLHLNLPSDDAAQQLFNIRVQRDEATLDRILSNNGIENFPNSNERLALISMLYAGHFQDYKGEFPIKTPLIAAINANDHAEAWYVIRYLSSHAQYFGQF